MDVISGLMLRSGRDLVLTSEVTVCHPTVDTILNINNGFLCEDYYWAYVFTILSDPYDFMVYLDDNGIDYEKTSAFDVFILRWNDAQKDYMDHKEDYQQMGSSPLSLFSASLSFFFGDRDFYITKIGDQLVIGDKGNPNWFLTKETFDLATQFISKCNCIVRDDQIKPANHGAKKILIEDRRDEEKKRKYSKDTNKKVERIADALATIDAGLGMLNSYDNLSIYRLLSTAQSVQKRIVVQAILNGIYTGMLKADKMSEKELRWV